MHHASHIHPLISLLPNYFVTRPPKTQLASGPKRKPSKRGLRHPVFFFFFLLLLLLLLLLKVSTSDFCSVLRGTFKRKVILFDYVLEKKDRVAFCSSNFTVTTITLLFSSSRQDAFAPLQIFLCTSLEPIRSLKDSEKSKPKLTADFNEIL